jgi:hypothetical protein
VPSNLAYLQTLLSGGAANTSPAKSLGGPISATRVLSQSATGLTTITGVTIEDAAGNAEGSGTLTYTYSATAPTLKWTPPSGAAGTAITVSTSGKYAIQGASNGGLLFVDVVASSLPSSTQTNTITIANQANKVWDDVSKAEALAGDTEYRCLYVKNTHSTDTMSTGLLWRHTDTAGQDVLSVELDPAGNGDGTSTGVASGCLQASKTLTAATWASSVATYTSTAHGYAVGDLVKVAGITPSGYNVAAGAITAVTTNTFDLAVTSNPGAYTSGGTVQRFEEGTAPAGVTFSSNAVSEASALAIGDLAPGQARAYWQKRVVPAQTTTATPANTSRIGLRFYI